MSYAEFINKTKKFIKNGQVPARYCAVYDYYASRTANCFIHAVFNFSNEQIYFFDEKDIKVYGKQLEDSSTTKEYLEKIITDSGLKVEQSKDDNSTLQLNQWRVAYFYSEDAHDFHFFLQERNGCWTEKPGFFVPNVKLHADCPDEFSIGNEYLQFCYEKKDTFIITNPYAPEKLPMPRHRMEVEDERGPEKI